MQNQKGITLVALIITIIILLILAVVTINSVNDAGIIQHAQNAKREYEIAQEKEQIGLAVVQWQLENNQTFKAAIEKALQGQVESIVGENEGPLTVTFKSDNIYTVKKDGEITQVTNGIAITPSTLSLVAGEEKEITVMATGVDIAGLTFSVEPSGIIEVTQDTNGKATVKAGTTVGTATITATCGSYTATCKVTVTEQLSVWQSRGVKSPNVVFDKVYFNNTKKCGNNDNIGFMFALCENKHEDGAVWINYEYDSTKTIDTLGDGSAPSEYIYNMMYPEGEEVKPTAFGFYDGVSFYNEGWFTIQYVDGYAKLYKSEPEFTEINGERYLDEASVTYLCDLRDEPVIEEIVHSGTIPEGGVYKRGDTTYTAGSNFPTTVQDGDIYTFGDYEYRYNQLYYMSSWKENSFFSSQLGVTFPDGWAVRVLDTTKSTYGELINTINNSSVVNMSFTFFNCTNLTVAPKIPENVQILWYTFYSAKIEEAPVIPNNVTNMAATFAGCPNLKKASAIPSSVTMMDSVFSSCPLLTGEVVINANPTTVTGCFSDTEKPITITGSASAETKAALAATADNGNVSY